MCSPGPRLRFFSVFFLYSLFVSLRRRSSGAVKHTGASSSQKDSVLLCTFWQTTPATLQTHPFAYIDLVIYLPLGRITTVRLYSRPDDILFCSSHAVFRTNFQSDVVSRVHHDIQNLILFFTKWNLCVKDYKWILFCWMATENLKVNRSMKRTEKKCFIIFLYKFFMSVGTAHYERIRKQ